MQRECLGQGQKYGTCTGLWKKRKLRQVIGRTHAKTNGKNLLSCLLNTNNTILHHRSKP